MMKIRFCFVVFLIAFLSQFNNLSAQETPARLIVRGDDMGFSHSGNLALIKCLEEGIQTSIEVIIPSPWFPEAVNLLKEHPNADVGIHLALTSEWDNVKWRPITSAESITDESGYFYPMIFPNENYPGGSIRENNWKLSDIERELRAQIELGIKMIPQVTHMTAHMGCIHISDEVRELADKLSKEYNLPILDQEFETLKGFGGSNKSLDERISHFLNLLESLEPGKTYLFVEHPGFDNEELRAIHHIGYENVAEDRQHVTDVFTNDVIKSSIKELGIILMSYGDYIQMKE